MSETKQVPGYANAYQRLLDLGPERLAVIEGKMAAADPTGVITDLIQQTWGLCTEVARPTLMRQLSRYRHQNVTPKMAVVYKAGMGGGDAKKALEALYDDLDMMMELRDIYELQKTRVLKAAEKEPLLPHASQEVTAAVKLQWEIGLSIIDFKFKIGQYKAVGTSYKGVVANSDGSKSAFAFTATDSRSAEMDAKMRRFMDLLEEAPDVPTDPAALEHLPQGTEPKPAQGVAGAI